jgi:hypothetical protein
MSDNPRKSYVIGFSRRVRSIMITLMIKTSRHMELNFSFKKSHKYGKGKIRKEIYRTLKKGEC